MFPAIGWSAASTATVEPAILTIIAIVGMVVALRV
jgi:hypothetical protein